MEYLGGVGQSRQRGDQLSGNALFFYYAIRSKADVDILHLRQVVPAACIRLQTPKRASYASRSTTFPWIFF